MGISRVILFSIATVLLVGCNSQLEQWAGDVKPNVPTDGTTAPTNPVLPALPGSASQLPLKMTPGKMDASASGLRVKGTLTATNQTYSLGADAAINLTINKKR